MNNKINYLVFLFIFVIASSIFAGNITTYKEAKVVESNLYRNYPSTETCDFCNECPYKAMRFTVYKDLQNKILYIARECAICGSYILQKATNDIINYSSDSDDLLKKAKVLFKGRNPLFNGTRHY